MNSEKLAAHLRVDRYGDFQLTAAIRPARNVPVVPRQGYRRDIYRDVAAKLQVPVLAAAVSREKLFDVFLELLQPLGGAVDVVLETSHRTEGASHRDLVREDIDLPVLMSHFCDYEELLLDDGCTGVAVISTTEPMEVQFDEHKLLVIYARDLTPFEAVLRDFGVACNNKLQLITEGEHLHNTEPRHEELFDQLCCRVGVAEPAEHVNW